VEPVIPDFAGDKVIRVTHCFAVYMWTASNWEFRLDGDVFLTTAEGVTQIDTLKETSEQVSEVIDPLVGARLRGILVSASGDLAIQFEHAQLSCRASSDYEAWELSGPVGEKIVCTPGGELAIWGPRVE
jgi:hypothetical protein